MQMLRSTLRWMTGFSGMDAGKEPEAANSSHSAVPESESSDSIEVCIIYFEKFMYFNCEYCLSIVTQRLTIYRSQVDNSRTVLLKIATLYAERLMNDICLVVDGVEYPAHRLILCASSDVFQVSTNLCTPG